MSNEQENKRRFSRVPFNTTARLSSKDGMHHWLTSLLDVSLKGALVQLPESWQAGAADDSFILEFRLSGSPKAIRMDEVTVAHIEEDRLGLHCHSIDVDSVTHLKKLMELNTGDVDMVHREIVELSHG